MAAKKKTKTPAVRAAQTRAEAEQLLSEIGSLQRQVTDVESEMNEQLSAIKAQAGEKAGLLNAAIDAKFAALHLWAEANRSQLLVDGAKTAQLATGELQWRLPPPSVKVTGQDVVLERLKLKGLQRFIRTKEEVDKVAILADPEAVAKIPGIKLVQDEQFIAKPFESEIERAATSTRSEA